MARQLQTLEDKVLELLSNAQGNILDDEVLINTLSESKAKSSEIGAKRDTAAETERRIDVTRQGFRPVAKRTSTLFFCVSNLHAVEHMYEWSMRWYIDLFERAIGAAPRESALPKRLRGLIDTFSLMLYRN
eukprot:1661095-Pleurochrysis_carterae.AAC.1